MNSRLPLNIRALMRVVSANTKKPLTKYEEIKFTAVLCFTDNEEPEKLPRETLDFLARKELLDKYSAHILTQLRTDVALKRKFGGTRWEIDTPKDFVFHIQESSNDAPHA